MNPALHAYRADETSNVPPGIYHICVMHTDVCKTDEAWLIDLGSPVWPVEWGGEVMFVQEVYVCAKCAGIVLEAMMETSPALLAYSLDPEKMLKQQIAWNLCEKAKEYKP